MFSNKSRCTCYQYIYGGYCLPKDTNALYAVAKTAGFDAKILKNVIITNTECRSNINITNRISYNRHFIWITNQCCQQGIRQDAKILKNVIITNDRMPEFITNRIMKVIGDKKNIRIAILGLSSKWRIRNAVAISISPIASAITDISFE